MPDIETNIYEKIRDAHDHFIDCAKAAYDRRRYNTGNGLTMAAQYLQDNIPEAFVPQDLGPVEVVAGEAVLVDPIVPTVPSFEVTTVVKVKPLEPSWNHWID